MTRLKLGFSPSFFPFFYAQKFTLDDKDKEDKPEFLKGKKPKGADDGSATASAAE